MIEKRQKFALSPTKVGSSISMGAHDISEFFHDPSMKLSNNGRISKKLYIKALDGGNGYSANNGCMRFVMTMAFEFAFENHMQEKVVSMARQYVRSIISSFQRMARQNYQNAAFVWSLGWLRC